MARGVLTIFVVVFLFGAPPAAIGLEQKVGERTTELEEKNAELERINQIFVGRELRMVELKERIKELEKKPNSESLAKLPKVPSKGWTQNG